MSLCVSTRVGADSLTSIRSIHTRRRRGAFGDPALMSVPPTRNWVNEESRVERMDVKALRRWEIMFLLVRRLEG